MVLMRLSMNYDDDYGVAGDGGVDDGNDGVDDGDHGVVDDDGADDADGYLIMAEYNGTIINALQRNALQLFNGMPQCHKAMQGESGTCKTMKILMGIRNYPSDH